MSNNFPFEIDSFPREDSFRRLPSRGFSLDFPQKIINY